MISCFINSLLSAALYVDYIFLGTDERRRMEQNPNEYLISQLQCTGDESVGSSSNKLKLNFNHPVDELVWVVQPDANVNYCESMVGGKDLYKVLGAQPFNYTDALDVLPNALHAFGAPTALHNSRDEAFLSGNEFGNPFAGGYTDSTDFLLDNGMQTMSGVSDAGTFVLAESSLDMHCWGENPVVTAKLQLNGQDRLSDREGSYFDTFVPCECHTRTPDTGINVLSFALRPEEYQPSGACNFSRIDNATLQLVLSHATVKQDNTAKVRIYAKSKNVLRLMSGMAGLAFSS